MSEFLRMLWDFLINISSLVDVVKNGLSNARRLELVDKIEQASSSQLIREWCTEQIGNITVSLRVPKSEDTVFLVRAARAKGIDFVRER